MSSMVEVAAQHQQSGAVHIAWTSFQRRQVSMAPLAGFECVFMPLRPGTGSRLRKAYEYVRQFFRTLGYLRTRRPSVVWVQLPQVPLLWAALAYRFLFAKNTKLVADCHNSMFRPPWSRVPAGIRLLSRCDLILVHNDAILTTALSMGLPRDRTLVLEDVPPSTTGAAEGALPAALVGMPRPWVLFPGSFSADEPVAQLLEAARLLHGGTIVLTGRTQRAARNGHDLSQVPPNVLLPGFLSVEDFDALLKACDVVLALTRFDGIQLSVCNEALGFGKPMVLSDTPLLRAMFSEAAVMVASDDPSALAAAIERAASEGEHLVASATRLAVHRRRAWLEGAFGEVRRQLARA
jgi:glycosyltransferase involved in cell wall biosynthesis